MIEALGQGRTLEDVVQDVVRDTGADVERVRSDYRALAKELRKARLITGVVR